MAGPHRARSARPPTRTAAGLIILTFVLPLMVGCGAASQGDSYPHQQLAYDFDGYEAESSIRVETVGQAVATSSRTTRGRERSGGEASLPAAVVVAPSPSSTPGLPRSEPQVASNSEVPSLLEDAPRTLPLLIYTASVIIAIYDVAETQARALEIAESMGGYSSQRADSYIVLRIPAERFREALEGLGELGDVLSLTWDAQDVSDEFTDLEIRLRNALQMRERLELLLQQAVKVDDALAIEAELQRITLEIEQLEGRRRSLVDRIAFATITLSFSQLPMNQVPGEEYRLPFPWLNELGVERLLSL